VAIPTLVVVSGPPGSGKTTLAHEIARTISCPAICRDEIKEGMVHAYGGAFEATAGDPLSQRTLPLFFEVLRVLLAAEVTVVAEAAFQDPLWRPGLEPLADLAELRIVNCTAVVAVARERIARRRAAAEPGRTAHAEILNLDALEQSFLSFARISLAAPSLEVDTTDVCAPDLAEIVAFVNRRGQSQR
jgi:predicted kinase